MSQRKLRAPYLLLQQKEILLLEHPKNADYIYFQYQGPETILRSDILKKDLITSVKLTHGNNIQKFLNEYEVTITNNPVAGQEYILRIDMLGYASLGIENTYQKYGFDKGYKEHD